MQSAARFDENIDDDESMADSDNSDEITQPKLQLLFDNIDDQKSPGKASEDPDAADEQDQDQVPADPNGWRALA